MATTQQSPDRAESLESSEALLVTEQKVVNSEKSEEQPLSDKDEKTVTTNTALSTINLSGDAQVQGRSLGESGEHGDGYPPNSYAPQAQTFIYGGYENPRSEWEEYPPHLGIEGEVGSAVVYNEEPSLVFHTGYGYGPQIPYGPYSPVTTPLSAVGGDGQLYSPQHFSLPGPYYQQVNPPSMPYLTSPTPLSQADPMMPIDPQGAFLADPLSPSGLLVGPRPGYQMSYGSFGKDWSKLPDRIGSMTPLSSPAASQQPIGLPGTFGQSTIPLASGMASQHQRSFYGYGSSNSSYDRGYTHSGIFQLNSNYGGPIPMLGINTRGPLAMDKGRRRGRGSALVCSCNGSLDFLNEQNRGPRATRPKKQPSEAKPSLKDANETSATVINHELYNSPDFATEYMDAKFFVIKSYSEDNVHKSIKYGVWASTTNGNRKLDAAYHEAKERKDSCPVFLFFSVNASAQFCGVAEMVGPVDFEKSVNYWQQDKWTGQFPVKWHIVKDVPNNLFRQIILENNDSKPVTNSRDTQEVGLEEGLKMLGIFKRHEADTSILDDFDFYEEREKAMQENKQRHHHHHQQHQKPSVVPPGDPTSQITESLAQTNITDPPTDRIVSGDSSMMASKTPEEVNTTTTTLKESS